jgi:hypothetical protein
MKKKDLLFFYGLDCPHCLEAERAIDDLILEGFEIEKLEIWHNEENDKLMEELDVGENACNGIPFFLNKKTGQRICGDAPYQEIKKWAEGK